MARKLPDRMARGPASGRFPMEEPAQTWDKHDMRRLWPVLLLSTACGGASTLESGTAKLSVEDDGRIIFTLDDEPRLALPADAFELMLVGHYWWAPE